MPIKYTNLQHRLDSTGYLSLNQFVLYLKEYYPCVAVSYPTAKRLAEQGKLIAPQIGSVRRVMKAEVERWIESGNLTHNTFFYGPRDPLNIR